MAMARKGSRMWNRKSLKRIYLDFLLDNLWAEVLCPIGIRKSKEEKL